MPRLLITGASGLLGANLVLSASREHEVTAVVHSHPLDFPEAKVLSADLGAPGTARQLIRYERPDWVIHCAAETNVDRCEADPERAFLLNRDMARGVAEACFETQAELVHISTDAVFDGKKGNYRESDSPNPINVYGRSKWEGEREVSEAHPRAVVCRTNIFGWNAQNKLSLAEWFLASFESRASISGFADVWISPLLVNDLAETLVEMLRAGLQGIFHVPGDECISKFDFGMRIAQVFQLDASRLSPISVDQAGLPAPRPKRLCLDGGKISSALGRSLPSLSEGLRRFRNLPEQGYTAKLKLIAGA